jgi:hypothetical protein
MFKSICLLFLIVMFNGVSPLLAKECSVVSIANSKGVILGKGRIITCKKITSSSHKRVVSFKSKKNNLVNSRSFSGSYFVDNGRNYAVFFDYEFDVLPTVIECVDLLTGNSDAISLEESDTVYDYGYLSSVAGFWVKTWYIENERFGIRLRIFDKRGKTINTFSSFEAKKIKTYIEGVEVVFDIPDPGPLSP